MQSPRLVLGAAQMKFQTALADNVDWICATIRAAARGGVDILLFPECALTGYNCDFREIQPSTVTAALAAIRQVIRECQCNVLLGCPTWDAGCMFNSLLVFNRQGREVFRYSKIHLTASDELAFTPGNALALFRLDRIPCTAIICHERRYPELVRIPVMLGAQIVFHPNAGLDSLAVSRRKRRGRDGIPVRAFENDVYYVFANSVGPQGEGRWSAGDSKIVAPDSTVLALANNRDATVIYAEADLSQAGRKYAQEALRQPVFLRQEWHRLLEACRRQLTRSRGR